MTATTLPPDLREELRRALADRSKQWLSRLYRHELLMARTVKGMQVEALTKFDAEVVKPLLQLISGRLSTFTLRGNDIVLELFPEAQQMIREIQQAIASGAMSMQRSILGGFTELARAEADWFTDAARTTLRVNVPDVDGAAAAARAVTKPVLGSKTEQWFGEMLGPTTANNVKAWVQTGVQRGLTTDEIVRGLRGTKDQAGILDKPRNAVASFVRTGATHVIAETTIDSYKAIGVEQYQFVATLDRRTSIQCAVLDGKKFPVGKGPLPPLHPNCRSRTVPYLEDALVVKRPSQSGPVRSDTDFRTWLDSQSMERQNQVLGRSRADAWRSGQLSFDRMLGPDLQPLSVAELRRHDLIPDPEDT